MKSWLKSFDRGSTNRNEDGSCRHKKLDPRSVREGISLISISKSEFSSRWRRVLYLSARTNWLDSVAVLLSGGIKKETNGATYWKLSPALRHSYSSLVETFHVPRPFVGLPNPPH